MPSMVSRTLAGVLLVAVLGCGDSPVSSRPAALSVDSTRLLRVASALAADSMLGRAAGTSGATMARSLLVQELVARGIAPLEGLYEHPFSWVAGGQTRAGVNVLGVIEGREAPGTYILLSAHYDHLGIGPDGVFNGADDNASGTAALLELASALRERGPRHSIIVAAFDAEELGLRGAAAFVAEPPVPLDRIALVINLDMIGRSPGGTLFAAGTRYTPALEQIIAPEAARTTLPLRYGFDGAAGQPDYTMRSDQGPFHQRGIPFILFVVGDDPVYHTVNDDFETLTAGFYAAAVRLAANVAWRADQRLELITH